MGGSYPEGCNRWFDYDLMRNSVPKSCTSNKELVFEGFRVQNLYVVVTMFMLNRWGNYRGKGNVQQIVSDLVKHAKVS